MSDPSTENQPEPEELHSPAPPAAEADAAPVETPSETASSLVQRVSEALRAEVAKVIVGQDEVVTQCLAALLASGHVLLEGVPGLAKTLLVRALAAGLGCEFKRVQFTPDLMPSDVTGTTWYNLQSGAFHLKRGPIFTSLLLADEVNRTPPKTQAALLEAMEERQVSIDGTTHDLPVPFMVFATQNPVEQEGTYPLPEAQLDRFLMKVLIGYPDPEEEVGILRRHHEGFRTSDLESAGIQAVADAGVLLQCREAIGRVVVEDGLLRYISSLVRITRDSPHLLLGASPRAGVALLQCGKVMAAMRGRDFVIPDDVKELTCPVLRHRVVLRPEAEIEGTSPDTIVRGLVARVEVPR